MKLVLILFPIQPYIDHPIYPARSPAEKGEYAIVYQQLIAKRYPDFQRVWVMFSEPESLEKPDLSQLWPGIEIKKNDIVIPAGITFEHHCQKKIYPDPATILAACPEPIKKLIIGGFHFYDCVEKLAEFSYRKGIDVLADDDLSEYFFYVSRGDGIFPLISNFPDTLKESLLRLKPNNHFSARFAEIVRPRENKPWLIQI